MLNTCPCLVIRCGTLWMQGLLSPMLPLVPLRPADLHTYVTVLLVGSCAKGRPPALQTPTKYT